MQIKCLSIKTPLAYMVAAGIKDVENRTWTTDYRGWIYIHSSGQKDHFFWTEKDFEPYHSAFPSAEIPTTKAEVRNFSIGRAAMDHYHLMDFFNVEADKKAFNDYGPFFVSSAIIGRVRLVDIVKNSDSPFAQPNNYHWILSDAEFWSNPLKQVVGKLRLFDFELPVEYNDSSLL